MTHKIALVTGAGAGIGRTVALALANSGFTVVVTGRRQQPLDQVVDEIKQLGATAAAMTCDVSDAAQVEALFAWIKTTFDRLDLLFNNAGIDAPPTLLEDFPLDKWRQIVDVNLNGAFYCVRAAFGLMKQQQPQGGRIINNGSVAAHTPRPDAIAYTATKHAMTGITKSAALDGRKYNIAVGQIDIGNADTNMVDKFKKGIRQADGSLRSEATMPIAHVGQTVAFMASLPLESNVLFMTIKATTMPFEGRG